eukprot:TRINITY_DN13526_c0_g1_i1.p2 TRINITY_DN13526_c0_g1~~TRINITY_DN13526_c0_g1_i1.p2  ORF type:complete len:125 (-),score=19.64 TRINITY_DN13526_c0_g1_i1:120-494(-)
MAARLVKEEAKSDNLQQTQFDVVYNKELPWWMRRGCRVVVTLNRDGTRKEFRGKIRYVGSPEFAKQKKHVWCGIELKTPDGRNDGSVDGTRYFRCTMNHGVFVKQDDVSPAPEKTANLFLCSVQ